MAKWPGGRGPVAQLAGAVPPIAHNVPSLFKYREYSYPAATATTLLATDSGIYAAVRGPVAQLAVVPPIAHNVPSLFKYRE
jgi:hypothetical protein